MNHYFLDDAVREVLERTLSRLANDIGSRPIGSRNNGLARRFLQDELSSWGLVVNLQPYEADYSYATGSNVVALNDATASIDSWPGFGSCGTKEIVASVVDCGFGTRDEIPQDGTGRVGLVRRGKLHEQQKVLNLEAAGCLAALLYVDYENALYSARVSDRRSGIPAVVIRAEDARRLRSIGVVRVTVSAEMRLARCANIVASTAGDEGAIVICAHYDSRPHTDGANDNAAGTACVMALAYLASLGIFKVPLRFVLFDGEEFGLLGSKFYANGVQDRGCEVVFNVDAVGGGSLAALTRDREGDMDPELIEQAIMISEANAIALHRAESQTGLSDHVPLRRLGARAFWLSDHPNIGRETDVDVAERISIDELVSVVTIVRLLLERIALPPTKKG